MTLVRHLLRLGALALASACLLPAIAGAATGSGNGGINPNDPQFAPPKRAKIVNGQAIAPRGAPSAVVKAIAAANKIVTKPYRYGGGHGKVEDTAYDCSGTISYALIKAGLLRSPLDSGSFMRWGARGKGKWITVWTNPGHAFVMIAGLRLDTGGRDPSANGKPGSGPRWANRARSSGGYTLRHPARL